jgi:acylphosphatase
VRSLAPGETMSATLPRAARLHLVITGRVQGVGFRYAAVDEARRLGLVGWTRNCPDGTVEIAAEGPRERLDQLAAWSHAGPPGAAVTHVAVDWSDATGEFSGFRIRS